MRIVHNISSMVANNTLAGTNNKLQKTLEKLATGFRVNRASDDAAGLSVSENLRAQVRGLQQAVKNAQDGINALQIADGAQNTITSILQRMRELALQSANDTYTDTQRGFLDSEYQNLIAEIDRITNTTQFNGQSLLSGDGFGGMDSPQSLLQIGANDTGNDRITVFINTMSTAPIALDIDASAVDTHDNALASIASIDSAIDEVNLSRSELGAIVNRLEYSIDVNRNSSTNMAQAESSIRDADMAAEMTDFTKSQILLQAGTAMLSQANLVPQSVLALFG